MAVQIKRKDTGETLSGKFAKVEKGQVHLFSGCMPDKKGGLRGCGKKWVFLAEAVTISADDPARELVQA